MFAGVLPLPFGPAPVGEPLPKLHRVIVWFRRDLRVEDNPALVAALQLAEEVVSGGAAGRSTRRPLPPPREPPAR